VKIEFYSLIINYREIMATRVNNHQQPSTDPFFNSKPSQSEAKGPMTLGNKNKPSNNL
jgi:hypothetical protein